MTTEVNIEMKDERPLSPTSPALGSKGPMEEDEFGDVQHRVDTGANMLETEPSSAGLEID